MPRFQTKPSTITIVSGYDSKIIPRNVKADFELSICVKQVNNAWDDSRIINTNNRYGQRLCLEARHINASPCALNKDDGSYLPQEYLHLVGR